MRRSLRKLYLDIFGSLSSPARGVHILNAHYLSPQSADPVLFYDLLNNLRQSCNLIRIENAVRNISSHSLIKEPCVAFTFDDGFEEQATAIAPVLENFGINAAFFINPGFIDGDEEYRKNYKENIVLTPGKKPMTWDQINALRQNGHIIGSHGQDHIRLNINDPGLISRELLISKQIIETRTGAPCEYFAYSYGGMNDLSAAALSIAQKHYNYIFSQSDHHHYFSFDGKVINRRHFEPFWPLSHVKYFLGVRKK